MKPIELPKGIRIGQNAPPFIIAEMSCNHNQSLRRAMEIVDAAADAGVQAVKLQTFKPDSMTLDIAKREFRISDPASPWYGASLYKLYQKAYTPWEWHAPLFKRCREKGLIGFSTPCDEAAVRFLQSLRVPLYKVASFENTYTALLRCIARTGKPLIISTGLATLGDIEDMVRTVRQAGGTELALLKCTSAYPAGAEDANLVTLPHLRKLFDCEIGLSDHSPGLGVSVAAVALGATIIERHLTLARSDGGLDAAFSLEPHELKQLVRECRAAWQAMGKVFYGVTPHERSSLLFRRSLYIVKDLQPGDRLTRKTMRVIRPGLGLPPKYQDVLLGQRVNRRVKRGTPVTWNLLK